MRTRFLNNNQVKIRRLDKMKKLWKPRIPTPKAGGPMKSKRDYDRRKNHEVIKREMEGYVSECCKALVAVEASSIRGKSSTYYVCSNCRKPCNFN